MTHRTDGFDDAHVDQNDHNVDDADNVDEYLDDDNNEDGEDRDGDDQDEVEDDEDRDGDGADEDDEDEDGDDEDGDGDDDDGGEDEDDGDGDGEDDDDDDGDGEYEDDDGDDEEDDGDDEEDEEDEEDEDEDADDGDGEYEDEDEDDHEDNGVDDGVDRAARKQANSLKWGLGAVIVLAIVAIVLVAVVLLGGDPSKDAPSGTGRNAAASGIASADDTGPAAIIIDDPSCIAWNSISSNMAGTLSLLGHGKWNERDQGIPASEWNDEQKKEYLAAGQVVRSAAAQTLGLVKLTPHRVMRELYEQFIAYARAFVEHIPNYTARDANLVGTAHSAASGLAAICATISNGSSAARGPLVEAQSAPTKTAPPGNLTNPQRFLTGPNPVCADWRATLDKFGADTVEWQGIDPSIPATYWNPQVKAINLAAGPVMVSMASKLQQIGRRSDNPILQDFADLSAQYRRAFVLALPTYDPSDNYLANAATFISTTVLGACGAVSPTGG